MEDEAKTTEHVSKKAYREVLDNGTEVMRKYPDLAKSDMIEIYAYISGVCIGMVPDDNRGLARGIAIKAMLAGEERGSAPYAEAEAESATDE